MRQPDNLCDHSFTIDFLAPRAGGVNVAGAGSTGTLEFGGGLDTKPLVHLKGVPLIGVLPIGGRVEVRDFYQDSRTMAFRRMALVRTALC